ncbi:hypothetical protein EMCRGX_G019778 [Ephydatia muelleri]
MGIDLLIQVPLALSVIWMLDWIVHNARKQTCSPGAEGVSCAAVTEKNTSALAFGCETGRVFIKSPPFPFSTLRHQHTPTHTCTSHTPTHTCTQHTHAHTHMAHTHTHIRTHSVKVVGIDYCGRFIDTAKQLHKGKELEYRKDPHRSAKAPSGTQTSHVEFKQLTWVPNEIHTADFVLFDFLERLDSPKAWLCKLWESVKTRGLLGIITSSTHWTPTNIQGIIGCYQEERAHKEQVKHGSLGLLCPRRYGTNCHHSRQETTFISCSGEA